MRLRAIWIVVLLLVGTGGARADEPTAASPAKLLSWLVGRWVIPAAEAPGLYWCEPDVEPSKRRKAREPAERARLELTVREDGDVLSGVLVAIASSGQRRTAVTFSIDRGKADFPLTWREADVRYRSPMQGTGYRYQIQPGDVERYDHERHLRFSGMRGPRWRLFPKAIDIRMDGEYLIIRRVQGPQHGAPLSQLLRFSPS